MRLIVLITIVILCVSSCSNKEKQQPKERESLVVADSEGESLSARFDRVQPLAGQFEYYPANTWRVESNVDLKYRLGRAVEGALDQLTELPSAMVFSGGVLPVDEGVVDTSNDYSAIYRNYWFVGSSERAVSTQVVEPGVDVWRIGSGSSEPVHIAYSEFADNEIFTRSVGALHVVDKGNLSALVVRRNQGYLNSQESLVFEKLSLPGPEKHTTSFDWFDLDTLTSGEGLASQGGLSIDGQYIASTRKGDTLYVVTRHWAWLPNLNPYSDNGDWFGHASVEHFMPNYRFNGEAPKPLSTGCLAPNNGRSSAMLVSLTAIDLEHKELISSQCINEDIDGVFFGEDSFYASVSRPQVVLGGLDGATELHQMSLSRSLKYLGGGLVPGTTLSWGAENQALKEIEGVLYLQTTQRDDTWSPSHNVFQVYAFEGGIRFRGLEEAFLKGVELLESRFIGTRAYIIPEEVSEPVTVVGLGLEEGPVFEGEMSLGSYGQNALNGVRWMDLGDNQILSIANQVNEELLSSGVELTLLDLSDANALEVLDSVSIQGNGTNSSAVHDYREVAMTKNKGGQTLIALPVSVYSSVSSAHSGYLGDWLSNSLIVLEVSPKISMELSHVSKLLEPSLNVFDRSAWGMRGVFSDEALYYHFDGQVLAGER